MKKIIFIFISIVFIGCDDYKKGQFYNIYNGTFISKFYVNKKANQQIDFKDSSSVPKFMFYSYKFTSENNNTINSKFDIRINFNLTDRSSKKRIWERDIYYTLIDSFTHKKYSMKVRDITIDRQNGKLLEISNLIEGDYDLAKDTLIYKCERIN